MESQFSRWGRERVTKILNESLMRKKSVQTEKQSQKSSHVSQILCRPIAIFCTSRGQEEAVILTVFFPTHRSSPQRKKVVSAKC